MSEDKQLAPVNKPETMAHARQLGDLVGVDSFGGGYMPAPKTMGEVLDFARLMAGSGPLVGETVRNNPGACLGILMQAGRLGMDPFALSQKAYIAGAKGTVAYEAQAIIAMIYASGVLDGRLKFEYSGDGDQLKVTVKGKLKGDDEVLTYDSPPLHQIGVKNSPLWKADPEQQFAYYGARAWARRHVPDVILGVYTPEELNEGMKNVTPEKRDPAERLQARLNRETPDTDKKPPESDKKPRSGDKKSKSAGKKAAKADKSYDSADETEQGDLLEKTKE